MPQPPAPSKCARFRLRRPRSIVNRAASAIINSVNSPISQELHNGDRVQEIITDAATAPVQLKWVKPTGAQVRHYFKTQRLAESALLNEQLLRQSIEHLNPALPRASQRAAGRAALACSSVANLQEELLINRPRHSLCQHHPAHNAGCSSTKRASASASQKPSSSLERSAEVLIPNVWLFAVTETAPSPIQMLSSNSRRHHRLPAEKTRTHRSHLRMRLRAQLIDNLLRIDLEWDTRPI